VTPAEAAAFAEIVENIDEAGGTVRDCQITHEKVSQGILEIFGSTETRPVYQMEIVLSSNLLDQQASDEESDDTPNQEGETGDELDDASVDIEFDAEGDQ